MTGRSGVSGATGVLRNPRKIGTVSHDVQRRGAAGPRARKTLACAPSRNGFSKHRRQHLMEATMSGNSEETNGQATHAPRTGSDRIEYVSISHETRKRY